MRYRHKSVLFLTEWYSFIVHCNQTSRVWCHTTMLAMFLACQPIVPMTTTVGAFNLKSLLSFCSYVVQVFNSILFFNKLLQRLLTTKTRRPKEIFSHTIIVFFKSLLRKRKNTAVNRHELTHMLHHCMYVQGYIIIMVYQ